MQYLKLALLCLLGANTVDAFTTTSFVNKNSLVTKTPIRDDPITGMKMVAGGAQAYEEMYDGAFIKNLQHHSFIAYQFSCYILILLR